MANSSNIETAATEPPVSCLLLRSTTLGTSRLRQKQARRALALSDVGVSFWEASKWPDKNIERPPCTQAAVRATTRTKAKRLAD
eukprot:scaffold3111_cov332-Prasinococcus_capsulatus_cf.AAC.5